MLQLEVVQFDIILSYSSQPARRGQFWNLSGKDNERVLGQGALSNMRIAILSDIHGNCVALDAVLTDIESDDQEAVDEY